jgi:hypothetical protein
MAAEEGEDFRDRLTPFLTTLVRLGSVLGALVSNGTAQFLETQRAELRRLAAVFALMFTAAMFACAAAGFAAYAILVALGEEHRAAACALIAACFALLSGIAALLARGRRQG